MNLINLVKYMFKGKSKVESSVPDHDIWYDYNLKLWTAQLKDENGNQIGSAGYGPDKKTAFDDLLYQNIDILE